jgi:hypothetical protein
LVPVTVVTEDAAVPIPKPEPGTGSVAEQLALTFAVVYHPLVPLEAGGDTVHARDGGTLSQPTEVTWKEAQLAAGFVSCEGVGLKTSPSVRAQSVVK